MSAPRSVGSIDRALREAEAILGPFPLATEASVPPKVAPFMTGMVATPCRLVAVALGPLIAPGSHFLELLVVIQDWSFTTLRLPEAIWRVISAPSLSIGEVVLVEQIQHCRSTAGGYCRCSGTGGSQHQLLCPLHKEKR
jgi:hypothetical protein